MKKRNNYVYAKLEFWINNTATIKLEKA